MKIKVYPLVWDTDNGTGCICYPTFKEALEALIKTALEYAKIREQVERLHHYLGCLADGENPDDVYSRFTNSVEGWADGWGTFWGMDTQYIEEQEVEVEVAGDALVKFSPYPATRPNNSTNYLVLFASGFTDSYWYDLEENEWFANEYSHLPETDVVAWADFPVVPEAPPVKHYVLVVWGDIEPQLIGPFETPGERDGKAREIRAQYGKENEIFPVDSAGAIDINSYSGAFFDE